MEQEPEDCLGSALLKTTSIYRRLAVSLQLLVPIFSAPHAVLRLIYMFLCVLSVKNIWKKIRLQPVRSVLEYEIEDVCQFTRGTINDYKECLRTQVLVAEHQRTEAKPAAICLKIPIWNSPGSNYPWNYPWKIKSFLLLSLLRLDI